MKTSSIAFGCRPHSCWPVERQTFRTVNFPGGWGDASVAFRAPRSIPPTGLRPWVPPAHEAAGGHGPLGITPGLQDTLTGTVTGRSTAAHPRKAALNCRVKAILVKTSYFRNLVMKVSMPFVATSRMWVMRLSRTGTSSGSMM